MAKKKAPEPPTPSPSRILLSSVNAYAALQEVRAKAILDARNRNPRPTQQSVAFEFGVSLSTVANIWNARTHKELHEKENVGNNGR